VRQGEIWFANLDPSKGSEQAGRRLVVVLSGNLLNENLPFVIIAPLTTKIKRYKGNPVLKPTKANGLTSESEILIFHLRSISKDRLEKKVGLIAKDELDKGFKTLNDILRY
jgi:mRNA interferase MazF